MLADHAEATYIGCGIAMPVSFEVLVVPKVPADLCHPDLPKALSGRLLGLCLVMATEIIVGCGGSEVTSPSGSEWQWQLIAPELEVRSLALSGDGTVFAGATDGVHRSRDQGRSWEWLSGNWSPGTGAQVVIDLDFGPGDLLACATTAGVYVSRDAGDTWELSQVTNQCGGIVRPEVVCVSSGGVLLTAAAGRCNGIFRSVDSGKSWEQRFYFLEDPVRGAQYLTASPPGLVFLGIGFGADMRSTDSGLRWEGFSVDGSSPYNLPYPTDVTSDGLGAFFLCNHEEIWKSVDEGVTWRRASRTGAFTTLASGVPGEIFAGTYDGFVHWTTTSGAEWTIAGPSVAGVVLSLAAGPQGELYVATAETDRSEYRLLFGEKPSGSKTTETFRKPSPSSGRLVRH